MQSVTLIIDKRPELSTKYKKLLNNEANSVIVSKDLNSAMKIIQDKEPDLIIISDSIDSDISDYCKKIRALTYNMRPVIVLRQNLQNFKTDWQFWRMVQMILFQNPLIQKNLSCV